MFQDKSKELLKENNYFLLEKLEKLENSLKTLQSQRNFVDVLPSSHDDSCDDDIARRNNFNDDDQEPLSNLKELLSSTEELNEIKFLSYTSNNLHSQEGLPPGSYREIETSVLFLNYFQVSISFVEDIIDNSNPVLFMKWDINDKLARLELSSLKSIIKNDLPSLFARLSEYAELSQCRNEALIEFSNKFKGFCSISKEEDGLAVIWKGLFKIVWNLKMSEYTEKIVNYFNISISEEDVQFIRASSAIMEKLTDISRTATETRNNLMEFGMCAYSYSSQ